WEASFEPVVIENFVAVRAHFHPSNTRVEHEIVVTPKMSFGTGHHATTRQMIAQMQTLDFAHKSIWDFGTGTGVLAILAEKLGAEKILATDLDDWSIDNATDNVKQNDCQHIIIRQQENTEETEGYFDIILANINKPVLLSEMKNLSERLSANGQLLLSGILFHDEEDIVQSAENNDFQLTHKSREGDWLC